MIVLLTAMGVLSSLIRCENPTYLPLESFGITDYKILEADAEHDGLSGTPSEGLRFATLTVSTPKTFEGELRDIARDIEADEDYQGYDYLEIFFTERFRDHLPLKAYAVVVLSKESHKVI
jgi:hypothetical protein